MKKIIALFVSMLLITGTVFGVNAIVYHYGAGGPVMTLNFYVDSSEVETTTFTEIEIIIKSSFSTYEDKTVIFNGKRVNIGNVKAESTLEGALITTGYTESRGAVTTFMFKSNEGVEISNNQPILSIINVNSVLYSSLDSIDYSVEKLVALDGTDYADKNIVKTDLIIPESTNPTLPAVGSLYVNNIKESDDSTNPSSSEVQPSASEIQPSSSDVQPDVSSETAPKIDNKTVKQEKKANPIKVTVKTKSVSYKKLKKVKQTVAPITVKKAQGKVTYNRVSGSKKLTLKSNGKIVVKKGTKRGTYKMKVKITAKGNSNYKSASKTVTAKIKVK